MVQVLLVLVAATLSPLLGLACCSGWRTSRTPCPATCERASRKPAPAPILAIPVRASATPVVTIPEQRAAAEAEVAASPAV